MSRQQTLEYRREYWKKWYAKNRAKHISNNTRYNSDRRKKIKKLIGDLKIGQGCMDCGYNAHPEALEFDHISDNKLFSVSHAIRMGFGLEKIMLEIDKCELVCANCHRVRTYNRRQQRVEIRVA